MVSLNLPPAPLRKENIQALDLHHSIGLSGTVRFRDMIVSYFRRKVYGLAVQVAHPLSSSSGIQQTKKRS